MFVWNEYKIKWFEKAAHLTDFYEGIARKCNERDLLNKSSNVLDVGCGLGYLSVALSPYVNSVTALDISEEAIGFLNKKCSEQGTSNIKPITCDWKKHKPEKRYDIVFICYCGGFGTEEFFELARLSRKYAVGIIPTSSFGDNFGISRFFKPVKAHMKRENLSSVSDFLEQNNIVFDNIEHNCEFGQPIDSMEEYKSFMEHYFDIKDDDLLKKHSEACLKKKGKAYYLPNIKRSNIIIVENGLCSDNYKAFQ